MTSNTMLTSTSKGDGVGGPGLLELHHVSKVFGVARSSAIAVDDVTLTIEPGQFVTLLGPSGCGKTTTLRMIAGFETPTSGDITLDGVSVLPVPPNRRPMSMVFQSYALFPNLSVSDNVGFGLKVKKVDKAERVRRVAQAMEQVGIGEYGRRYPHELSGGQQQRVALARALVMEPKMLLFDEPLSNLDAKLRERMRDEIKAIQRRLGVTSVFVTHDQTEAMTMSDVIVVMNQGRVEQIGSPRQVYGRPETRFVAAFLGKANFLTGKVVEAHGDGQATIHCGRMVVTVPCHDGVRVGGQAMVLVRAEGVRVSSGASDQVAAAGLGSSACLDGKIVSAAFDGPITVYRVATGLGEFKVDGPGARDVLPVGAPVSLTINQAQAWALPGDAA
ncbi:MAG: ABC transporter ATP-binding protein [Propionibacteriaceae bacterium]|jgi:iron(III) transport system ATP-binding protein|nr:ABC transporter ATP-binding protein [Propionibacteriaceae bacterium]